MTDVAVIGSGIMGAAVARELSLYDLNIIIIEKSNDVSCGTTKANSAIVHAGYDAKEGTLMAKYNVEGNAMYEKLCSEVDAPYRKTGSYVLAFSKEDRQHLELLYRRGINNNVPELEIIEKEELRKREPHISKEAVAALYAGTAGITGPWELAIKLIENAMENGAELKLNSEVIKIEKTGEHFLIHLKGGTLLKTRSVINAAGVHADTLNNMLSEKKFTITPRIGEYFLLDRNQGYLTDSIIFQCPTEMGKGVLIAKTVHGNILVGPTASDVENRNSMRNTQSGLDSIRESALKSLKDINFSNNIKNFAGLRAESDTGDFILGESEDVKGFFNMAGTKSPGLTAAPAMAHDLAQMVVKYLGNVKKSQYIIKNRKQLYFSCLSPEEKSEIIKKDSKYGRIICRCENITEGEIIDSIHRKCGGRTLNGIKRRCRPGSGRCQGGFCGPRVMEILARELNMNMEDIVLEERGSYILTGKTR